MDTGASNHANCWRVVYHSMQDKFSGCGCPCHDGEEYMASKGGASATVSHPEGPADNALTLQVAGQQVALSWAEAHAARDALAKALHQHAGASIVERLEEDLDKVMDSLMSGELDEDALEQERGWARGLATAISYMRTCDIDDVRAQAMERWENRQP